MKKQIRFIIIFVMCLSLLLPVSVFAASKVTLNKKTYIKTGSGSNIVSKFKTNKGFAYCITPGKSGPGVGTTMYLKNTIKSGGLVYLLDQAGTSDSSYLVTQLAVWKYANNFQKSASSSNWAKANKLVSAAKKNSKYSTTPSVGIKASSSSLSESGNYYKSGKITITAKNIKKDLKVQLVNAPKGAKIVNSKGTKKTSFKNGDVIYVYVPTSSVSSKTSFSIKISGTGYITYVERYKSKNANHQELLIIIRETKKVSASTKLSITPVVRKCKYYNGKYYGKDGKVVDKTTYSIQCESHTCEKVGDKYFGKDGNIVDKTTFDKECNRHVCEIIDNTYFGKDGTEVDKHEYTLECEKHYCEVIDGYYFGKNGYEVDSTTYDKECNKHVCEIIDDTYFGSNGNVVDYVTYKNQCEPSTPTPVVKVPDTDDKSGLLFMLFGVITLGTIMGVLETLAKNN